MFQYADTQACPACRAPIAARATRCDSCATQLTGSVAQRLFGTLVQADALVSELRQLSASSTAARTAPAMAPAMSGPGAQPGTMLPSGLPSYPAPTAPPERRTSGLSAASGPRILLGLGALCLLVAAIVFLAVTWQNLGVGGRTVVLLALTTTAGTIAGLLTRKSLRGGAEAFTTVALGLLAVDIFGAESAGWLGSISAEAFAVLLGAVAGLAALGVAMIAHKSPLKTLYSAQVISGLGFLTATVGLAIQITDEAGVVVALALTVALGLGAHRLALRVTEIVLASGATLWWSLLLILALVRFDATPTYREIWLGLDVWPLLVCTVTVSALALLTRISLAARVSALTVGVALGTLALLMPVVDEGTTARTLTALVVVLGAAAGCSLLTDLWRWIVSIPLVVAGLMLLAIAFDTAISALFVHLDHGAWTAATTAPLKAEDLGHSQAFLLPLSVAGLIVAAWTLTTLLATTSGRRWVIPGAMLTLASLAVLPGMYGAPALWAVVALLVLAAGVVGVAMTSRDIVTMNTARLLSAGVILFALGTGLISDTLTGATTGVLVLAALGLSFTSERVVRWSAEACFIPLFAGFAWTVLHLLEVDASWRALPVLVVAGLWAIAGPRLVRELPVMLTAVIAISSSLTVGSENAQTWLAIDLTLAGALVAITALVHEERRLLGWLSLGLLTLAQWVRLDQVGVDVVEAYTLPLALILIAVGVIALRRTEISSFRALTSGLVLALTPSLVVALGDPISLRALLLGVACAVIVIAGAALRWSAPLVIGGAVGALLVFREVDHADILRQWMVIGLIGLTLITVGATWERSLAEVRDAAARLRRLR